MNFSLDPLNDRTLFANYQGAGLTESVKLWILSDVIFVMDKKQLMYSKQKLNSNNNKVCCIQ